MWFCDFSMVLYSLSVIRSALDLVVASYPSIALVWLRPKWGYPFGVRFCIFPEFSFLSNYPDVRVIGYAEDLVLVEWSFYSLHERSRKSRSL